MSTVVTRAILEEHLCCANGLRVLDERLNGRTEMPLQEFKNLAFEVDSIYPEDHFVAFAMNMLSSPKFYLLQGAYTMNDKYQVFNPTTGRYEDFTDIDLAKARRQELIQEYLNAHIGMFNINREIVLEGSNDVTWVPIKELPPATPTISDQ